MLARASTLSNTAKPSTDKVPPPLVLVLQLALVITSRIIMGTVNTDMLPVRALRRGAPRATVGLQVLDLVSFA
jgi:hypothetical protein